MSELVHLLHSPLTGLLATLLAYQIAARVQKKAGDNPLLNPVLLAAAALALWLRLCGISYAEYFEGARMVHFLLGPATVALAVPLYGQLHHVRRALIPILAAVATGSIVAMASAMGLAWALGASRSTVLSLAPKSVTTPIAMALSEKSGGDPQLTVLVVVLTGVLGAMAGRFCVERLGIHDWKAIGLAMGSASHGVGTARAVQLHESAGAFASLAMGSAGLLTALLLPWVVRLLPG